MWMPLTGGMSICTQYCTDEDVKEMWCMSLTVPSYHWICLELEPHSYSACTRLTEIFPPALQGYIENAIIINVTTL